MTSTLVSFISTSCRSMSMNSPGASSVGSTCNSATRPEFNVRPQVEAELGDALEQSADAFVELVDGAVLAPFRRSMDVLHRQCGLAGAGRAAQQGAGAAKRATIHHAIQRRQAARYGLAGERHVMLAGVEPREHFEPSALDRVVVPTLLEGSAAHLGDLQAPAGGAEVACHPLECDHSVAEAAQMLVRAGPVADQIVEQEHGGAASGKELLKRKDLPAESQCVLRQQAHLRQAVEHHADSTRALRLIGDQLDGLAELHLPRMEQRHLAFGAQGRLGGGEFEHVDAVETPAVRGNDGGQLLRGFRKRHVEDTLAARPAVLEKLQRQGGLASTWRTLDQVKPVRGDPSIEDRVPARPRRWRCGWK